MSELDELFSDLQEDLQKLEQEETEKQVAVPPTFQQQQQHSSRALQRNNQHDQEANNGSRSGPDRPMKTAASVLSPGPAESVAKKPKVLAMVPAQLQQKKREAVVIVSSKAATDTSSTLQRGPTSYSAPVGTAHSSSFPTLSRMPPLVASSNPLIPSSLSASTIPAPAKGQLVFGSGPASTAIASTGIATKSTGESQGTESQWRLFIGNLGPEVRDEHLQKAFKDYSSVTLVRAVMEAKDKCKGYGFVHFADGFEMLRAMREKQGKLCGIRPMLIKKAKVEDK